MWPASLDSPARARPTRHVHPRGLREPLDAAARGPPRAPRRLARTVRLGREAAGRADRPARGRARLARRAVPPPRRAPVLGLSAGRVGGGAGRAGRGARARRARRGDGVAGSRYGAPRHAALRLRPARPALRRVARDRTRTRPAGARADRARPALRPLPDRRARGDDPARRDRGRGDGRRVAPGQPAMTPWPTTTSPRI